jgi:hypothetical protein
MQHKWIASLAASKTMRGRRDKTFHHTVMVFGAEVVDGSEQQAADAFAHGMAMTAALDAYPVDRGYDHHHVEVMQIEPELSGAAVIGSGDLYGDNREYGIITWNGEPNTEGAQGGGS